MTRIEVDQAAPAVKKFIRSLALDASGVEVTLDGNIVCRIIPPNQLSDVEKEARLDGVRQLLKKSRDNSKRHPSIVVEKTIREALKTVRKGR